ncbi:MAG TPA: hypothetical protein VEF76_14595 [Patescibacteria group bacterium]|nr:hypothetical protein [Patescibacteria group bacterium]
MSLSALFDKKSSRLRAALRSGDLLAAEPLIARTKRADLAAQIDEDLAPLLTPGMAALISGPNGALAAPVGEIDIREYPRSSLFFHLFSHLLAAGNVAAAEVLLLKEKDHLNGRHGTPLLKRVVESAAGPDEKARLVARVLKDGHDRMDHPGTVALSAQLGKLKDVVEIFAQHGIKPEWMPPPPPPSAWFYA